MEADSAARASCEGGYLQLSGRRTRGGGIRQIIERCDDEQRPENPDRTPYRLHQGDGSSTFDAVERMAMIRTNGDAMRAEAILEA